MNTPRISSLWLSVLGGTMLCGQASAAIHVQYLKTNFVLDFETTFSSGADFTIAPTSVHDYVKIFADNTSTENIGKITVRGSGTNTVWVLVSKSSEIGNLFSPLSGCKDWAGLSDQRGNIILKGRTTGNLTGYISVSTLWSFKAGNQIQSSINAEAGAFFIEAASISSAGDLTLESGSMSLVRVLSGDMLGGIVVNDGDIDEISVVGNIGTSADPVMIYATSAAANGN